MIKEIYGKRDLTYNDWHRTLPRFCDAIDIDMLEVCNNPRCRLPLAITELAQDVGQNNKNYFIIKRIADLLNIPAYVVLYKTSDSSDGVKYISGFRIKRVDGKIPEQTFTNYTVLAWNLILQDIHSNCKHPNPMY